MLNRVSIRCFIYFIKCISICFFVRRWSIS